MPGTGLVPVLSAANAELALVGLLLRCVRLLEEIGLALSLDYLAGLHIAAGGVFAGPQHLHRGGQWFNAFAWA